MFVSSMLATSAAALLVPRNTKAADSRIEILLNKPVGTISPNIYSHFIEHLGGVIYEMRVFGVVPLEIYLQTKQTKYLELGRWRRLMGQPHARLGWGW